MLHTVIQGVEVRWNTLDSKPAIYNMYIRWDEADPMVFLYAFVKPDAGMPKAEDLWRLGRHLVILTVINRKHMGLGDLRLGPLTEQTIMLHQIYKYPKVPGYKECFFTIPTAPLRAFLIKTLEKVSPIKEQEALERYIDKWVHRTLTAAAGDQ